MPPRNPSPVGSPATLVDHDPRRSHRLSCSCGSLPEGALAARKRRSCRSRLPSAGFRRRRCTGGGLVAHLPAPLRTTRAAAVRFELTRGEVARGNAVGRAADRHRAPTKSPLAGPASTLLRRPVGLRLVNSPRARVHLPHRATHHVAGRGCRPRGQQVREAVRAAAQASCFANEAGLVGASSAFHDFFGARVSSGAREVLYLPSLARRRNAGHVVGGDTVSPAQVWSKLQATRAGPHDFHVLKRGCSDPFKPCFP